MAAIEPSYGLEETAPPPPWVNESPSGPRITAVRCDVTAPEGVNLVVVTIETDDPAIVGHGCATFHQRAFAVQEVVTSYLAPLLVGRDPHDVTDIGHGLRLDSYWRSGPVLNNALAGVDIALWDIKGKAAGLPVWQLLGGRVRTSVPVYAHATGTTVDELVTQVRARVAAGYRHVRCQVSVPGSSGYGARNVSGGNTWSSRAYLDYVPAVLREVIAEFGGEVRILHDVHERVPATELGPLLRAFDDLDLYFLEDVVAPEDLQWLTKARAGTKVPLAIGELFVNTAEYVPVVQDRLAEYIRCHVTAIGGLTPAWRLASLCELYGVRTAWHGPRDVSPIGHAVNFAIDIASTAFGIQEHHEFSEAAQRVFPGTAVAANGTVAPSYTPGIGVGFDRAAAADHPPVPAIANWPYGRVRTTDGTVQRP